LKIATNLKNTGQYTFNLADTYHPSETRKYK
jgi:hypothetical protein